MITYKILIGEGVTDSNGQCSVNYVGKGNNVNIIAQCRSLIDSITLIDSNSMLLLQSDKNTIYAGEQTQLTASLLSGEESESVYINKIIDDEDLNMELTSIRNQYNHIIKTKVTDENDNGLENIRIKLYKED